MARDSAVSLVFVGFCRFSVGFCGFSESVFLSVVSLDSVLTVGARFFLSDSPYVIIYIYIHILRAYARCRRPPVGIARIGAQIGLPKVIDERWHREEGGRKDF